MLSRMTPPLPGTANPVAPQGSDADARPLWLLAGPALAAATGAFLLTVPIGSVWSAIQRDLGLPTVFSFLTVVAYLVPAVLAAGIGVLVGRRWPTAVTLPAAALLLIGALLTTLSPGTGVLLVSRAVAGFGAGLAWGVTAMLVMQAGPRRTIALPIVAGAGALALIAGPVAGAVVAQILGWRWPFLLAIPMAIVAFLAAAVGGIIGLTRRTSPPVQPPAAPTAQPPAAPIA